MTHVQYKVEISTIVDFNDSGCVTDGGTMLAQNGGMKSLTNQEERERNECERWNGVGPEARRECEHSRLWEFASAYLGAASESEVTGGASTGDSVK